MNGILLSINLHSTIIRLPTIANMQFKNLAALAALLAVVSAAAIPAGA